MTIRRCVDGDERAGQRLSDSADITDFTDFARDIAMKLTIKYFASIREQLDTDEEVIQIDAHELTVDALRATLAARDARSGEALRIDRPVRAAVNREMVTGGFVVREDSEVAFFPPVTGG